MYWDSIWEIAPRMYIWNILQDFDPYGFIFIYRNTQIAN